MTSTDWLQATRPRHTVELPGCNVYQVRHEDQYLEKKQMTMTNATIIIERKITVNGQKADTVIHFKYLVAINSQEGSKLEVLARSAHTAIALTKLNPI